MSFRPLQDMQFSLGSLQSEMNSLLERLWHGGVAAGPFDGQQWAPPINLYEHGDHYTLYAEVPGLDAAQVELTHVGTSLCIRGEKSAPQEMGEADRPLRSERRFGSFCRTIELPGDIDAGRLSAKCQAGVLKITIPKAEASLAKSINIEVEGD